MPVQRIRRIGIQIEVESYDDSGRLKKPESQTLVMFETDFSQPVQSWLVAQGVPPQLLGLTPASNGATVSAVDATRAGLIVESEHG